MADYLETDRPKPDGEALRASGKKWIERINAAEKLEENWVDDAEVAVSAYTGDKTAAEDAKYDFNIQFSNVETIVPAIINSPPQPDIRRRFADDDPVAKDGSELLERAIRIQVDDSRLQIEMEAAAQDAFLAGRGVVRLRFKADVEGEPSNADLHRLAETFIEDKGGAGSDDRRPEGATPTSGYGGQSAAGQTVKNERICFEAVSWRDFRHGPAKRWQDIPWCAFRHAIPMEDLEAFADKAITDAQTVPEDKLERGDTDNDVVVWEVWSKKDRKVRFVEEDTGKVLKIVDDPLGLSMFFPICTPIQPIEVTGRLMPVNPFSIYRKLADELDTTTRRIGKITEQMRVRGWYPGDATDIANMLSADDNDFVPISNPEIWAQNGGIEKAVAFWPIEKFIVALRELYANREQTKQAIYEITGISDIVRGATKATETLGAQQIKSQWGSLRIQKMQRMIERAARDIFVMMAEIIPSKFSAETLEAMTGIQLKPKPQEMIPLPPPPQPPMDVPPEQAQQVAQQHQQAMAQYQQAEQARQKKLQHMQALNALLNDDVTRFYRIDVESDSTVRADLTQKKQEQAEFLQGAAAFFQGIVPALESGVISKEGAISIFAATARLFTLGKSTEDALDQEITKAKEASKQPPQPSPEQIKAQGEQAKMQAEAKMQQDKHQMEMQSKQADLQMAEAKHGLEMEMMQAEMQVEQEKLNIEREKLGLQREAMLTKAAVDEQRTAMQVEAQREQFAMDREASEHKHELGMKTMEAKAAQAAKPKAKSNGAS